MTAKSLDSSNLRRAVFAGTFDPFTVGHEDIVRRGLDIFDEIIICVGVNMSKDPTGESARKRVAAISEVFADEPRVSVRWHDGITAVLAKQLGAQALLRGVRSVKDFEYERDMADANRKVFGLDTVILYSDPEYSWVSSSLVRELQAYGEDVSHFLPKQK